MKSTSSRAGDRGFTLVEVLLAVSITAVALTMLYGSFFQLMDAKSRVETKGEMAREADMVLSRLRTDLTNVFARGRVNPAVSSSRAHDYFRAWRKDDGNSVLFFTSFAHDVSRHSPLSDQSEISYYTVPADADNDARRLALVRKDNRWMGNDSSGVAYPISERVLSFSVNFLTRVSFANERAEKIWQWDSSVVKRLPAAVEIQIVMEEEDGRRQTRSALVSIPVAN